MMPGSLHFSRTQWLGAGLLLSLAAFGFLVPWLSSDDAASQNLSQVLFAPGQEHWLGTDHFGRDMWVRLAEAVQLSVMMAVLCMLTSAAIGVGLGVLAATGPAWLDRLLDAVVTLLLALPGLVFVLILAAIAPGSLWILYLAICLVQWIEYFRVSRVITRSLIHSPEVQSSRLMGFGAGYLFKRHYWPAIAPQLLTLATFGAANAILMMASLGFVSVGVQPPLAELGLMIVELFPFYAEAPWLLAQPLVVLALLVLSFHLLGRRSVA